ncbi:MAG: response regulator [Proteobacteria bacterium]|nr:response regulator [Pseudomonadota bacterium]MBU4298356.1 response regulator [Pseudomonadota bacterium]MCG2746911.1 response regulator [Desulfobulbaceae bacterium]
MTKILVIDDERPILEMLKLSLSSEGYDVLTAENGEKALKIFKEQCPQLVLTDIKMPGIDGIEVLKRIKTLNKEVEVIVITGHGDMDTAIAALQHGASDFVTKPLRDEVLMVSLERAKKKLAMCEQLKDYTENLEKKVEECKLGLRQAQDELVKTERLASIGETVSGLAHYIKNIMTGLGGGIYMVHTGMAKEKPDMMEEGWAMFQHNIERVSDLVLDLLRYAKQTAPQRGSCRLNEIVPEVMRIFKEEAGIHKVKLSMDLDPDLKEADIEYDGMRRALVNLISNAIDACIYDVDLSKKWEVVVKTRIRAGADHGKNIHITVVDNGCGMTDEVKGQLFQRFFTTKAGRGIGLGLLVTQKVVHEHGGEILLDSTAGQGTTVSVLLPVI